MGPGGRSGGRGVWGPVGRAEGELVIGVAAAAHDFYVLFPVSRFLGDRSHAPCVAAACRQCQESMCVYVCGAALFFLAIASWLHTVGTGGSEGGSGLGRGDGTGHPLSLLLLLLLPPPSLPNEFCKRGRLYISWSIESLGVGGERG